MMKNYFIGKMGIDEFEERKKKIEADVMEKLKLRDWEYDELMDCYSESDGDFANDLVFESEKIKLIVSLIK